jgi:hypothetical protein
MSLHFSNITNALNSSNKVKKLCNIRFQFIEFVYNV